MSKSPGCGKIGFLGFCICLCFFFFVKFFSGYSLYKSGHISTVKVTKLIDMTEGVYVVEFQITADNNTLINRRVQTFNSSYRKGKNMPVIHDKKEINKSTQFAIATWWATWGIWLVAFIIFLLITIGLFNYKFV